MSRAKNATVWDRVEHDWYIEPERATNALLSVERFEGETWDPSAGGGNIVRTFLAAGLPAFGTDIVRRTDAPWFRGEMDFYGEAARGLSVENIVMNPPYYRAKGTEAFIRFALDQATQKVAAFCDVRFLGGASRASGLFSEAPPSRIWWITPRVSCPPGVYLAEGGKAEGGTAEYCWIVWDREDPAPAASLGWLALTKTELKRAA